MWQLKNGRFTFQQQANVPSTISVRSTVASATTTQNDQQQTTIADTGTFVDVDSNPANETLAVGVAQSGVVVSSGVTTAYVIDALPKPRLSGIYTKTVNGIPAGKVVLLYDENDHSFIMASTKSNEVDALKARLDALTIA